VKNSLHHFIINSPSSYIILFHPYGLYAVLVFIYIQATLFHRLCSIGIISTVCVDLKNF